MVSVPIWSIVSTSQLTKWFKTSEQKHKSDIQGSIAHRARLEWVQATASVETANVEKVFIIGVLLGEVDVENGKAVIDLPIGDLKEVKG